MFNARSLDRPARSNYIDYGPFHVMVIQDVAYKYGYKGKILSRDWFTGIFVQNGGNSYDPGDPPTVEVLFNGQSLGIKTQVHLAGDRIDSVDVTDWGLHASHTGNDATITAHWGNDYSGAWTLQSVTVNTPGTGYSGDPPWVIIGPYGGSGSPAQARAYLNGSGGIDRIEVVKGGSYNLNAGWFPHPTVTLEDPPNEYPCIPEIQINDPGDNTSASLTARVGCVVEMLSANHHIESWMSGIKMYWRESGAMVGPLEDLDATVDGRLVHLDLPTSNFPLDPSEYPPEKDTLVWLMAPPEWRGTVTVTPPTAGLGQPGYVKYNGLAKIVQTTLGRGYTPGSHPAVSIVGGSCEQAATAEATALEDGTLQILITDQGKKYASPPAVSVSPPPAGPNAVAAVCQASIASGEAYTVRMYNPWTHGIQEGDELQVCWKEGEGILWQYMQQAARYSCDVLYVGNGCVTFNGGLEGPDPTATTQEVKDPAGQPWIVPTTDDYPLQLYAGRIEGGVRAPYAFGLMVAIVRQGVTLDLLDVQLNNHKLWDLLGDPSAEEDIDPANVISWSWWGMPTDINAMTRLSS